jgi:tetratricopeptide (TPR) repeat protein
MVVCAACLVLAPLAAGGVHRPTLIVLMALAAAGLALLGLRGRIEGRPLRVGVPVLLPLVFLLAPLLQSIPIPLSLRRHLDPHGTALIEDNSIVARQAWPLSLDPPNTRVQVGRAAAALAAFLFAFHVASGPRRRHLVPRVVGATGIAVVVVGLGHRVLGFSNIYGLFHAGSRTLLTGPFVNANHTAELLELTAFACLACSFQRQTMLNRAGWLTGTLVCAAGAAATLSRGAVLGMTAGILLFVFLRYFVRDEEQQQRRRAALAWGLLLTGLVVVGAGAVGASQILDRFHRGAMTSDVRLHLWRDSLQLLSAHPLGIGRGAFDRVYPVYRTVATPFPLRFAYVENEPLQLLLDCGWPLFFTIVAAGAFLIWRIVRAGRRDRIEAALAAGLFAVLAHSLVDFGLETLGVLLPFAAVAGTLFGRLDGTGAGLLSSRRSSTVVAVACAGLVFGTASVAHSSYDDFDAKLKAAAPGSPARAALVARAQEVHPVDYFYALTYARMQPIRRRAGEASPRLHALNRALRLCPSCEAVHLEVARTLWPLGLRDQALVEWRTAVQIQPALFAPTLRELLAAGAAPADLASVATFDPKRVIEVADFLAGAGRVHDAFGVLDQADAQGAPRADSLLTRARLQIASGELGPARDTLSAARAVAGQEPRFAVLEARLLLARGADGADEALRVLDAAAARYPGDLEIQRMRVNLVMQFAKWHAADRALEGLKLALYQSSGAAGEAHVAAARIKTRMARWTGALGEYRIALADIPWDVGLWLEFGQVAEQAGRDSTAREAYTQAARLAPSNTEVAAALRRIDERQSRLRSPSSVLDTGGASP